MTSKMKIYVISSIVLLVLLIFGLFYYNYDVLAPFFYKEKIENKSNISLNSLEKAASGTETFINKDGKNWAVPDKAEFSVSSGNGIITFLQGEINPLKVHPGDVQNMKIVVQGVNGIDKVAAEIETDNGINKVNLKKTGVLAIKDLDENFFVYNIDKNGRLAILSNKEAEAKRQIAIKSESASTSINTASAASGEREIWEGSWTVKDTSVREYSTTFVATDSQGNKEKFVLAWSDPCPMSIGGTDWWTSGGDVTSQEECSIAQPYGVDNGNLTLNVGADITVLPGGKLVFNPGKGIVMPIVNHGSVIIIKTGANASMSKGYLWAEDVDDDGYTPSDNRQFTTTETAPASDWIRQKDLNSVTNDCNDSNPALYNYITGYKDTDLDTYTTGSAQSVCSGASLPSGWRAVANGNDCLDSNANVKPGQTTYFASARPDNGSFDYNCDGQSTYEGLGCAGFETYCEESELSAYKIVDINGDDGSIPYNGITCTHDVPANGQPAVCGTNNWQFFTIGSNKEYPQCTANGGSHYYRELTTLGIVKCH